MDDRPSDVIKDLEMTNAYLTKRIVELQVVNARINQENGEMCLRCGYLDNMVNELRMHIMHLEGVIFNLSYK